jgi:hypothetical protein
MTDSVPNFVGGNFFVLILHDTKSPYFRPTCMPHPEHSEPQHDDEIALENSQTVVPPIPKVEAIELDNFRLDINYFLSKDYEDIATASTELPAIIEWINSKLQSMTEQKLRKEDEVKELEADTWFWLVGGGWEDRNYGGRKNAYALLMGVRVDPKVKKAKQELAVLTAWTQRLYNVMTSFQAKLELVRSAEATRRHIFDSQERQ